MTVHSTPFQEITEATLLPRIVRLGSNLYGAVFTLMKLVPARYILRRALERGELEPGTVIVETTSGTFGLALAMQAALLRRDLVLVSDPVIDRNLHRRLADLGATVDIVEQPAEIGGFQASRLDRLAELRSDLPQSFCPEQYTNPDNPASYALVAERLADALGTVDCVIGPVGSGGSLCGTVRALRGATPHTRAIGVDTHRSLLFGQEDGPRQLRGLGNSLMPGNLDHGILDEVHWVTAAEAYATTRWAHRRHALFQGPTSGAALLAARWWAEQNPEATCVVMLPDEGYRYLETVYDDAWTAGQGLDLSRVPDKPVEVTHPREAVPDQWSWYPWRRQELGAVLAEGGRR
ncbi:cystathionine beta-synthase/cysteine synthase [Streptomyces xiamenensis]|uniref:Cystathionine beta-synthase/cysteine synthase n=1 Tax=Streptomyces xiamenensis TaxID=408015 RepID=A0A0F7G271_9ACTN|nr:MULTISPECIES: pyridoxal-phosphate dependent enzyme [Streptomyces]AKG46650.1 cystathionine beta-synthase/cysteine synthase [Streptomyces xiamenensis]